jgi:hypothetical protein
LTSLEGGFASAEIQLRKLYRSAVALPTTVFEDGPDIAGERDRLIRRVQKAQSTDNEEFLSLESHQRSPESVYAKQLILAS